MYTAQCKSKIDLARNAYNALTNAQKALVINYNVLTAAENTYRLLKTRADNAANVVKKGDVYKVPGSCYVSIMLIICIGIYHPLRYPAHNLCQFLRQYRMSFR